MSYQERTLQSNIIKTINLITKTHNYLSIIFSDIGKQPILNSIAVMPELYDDDISKCIGICSDYISKYLIKII